MKSTILLILLLASFTVFSQKKVLNHKDVETWNTIKGKSISSNGKFVMYSLEKGEGDNHLKIKNSNASLIFDYKRGKEGQFTQNSEFAIFKIKAWKDSVIALKRKKIKKEKLPKDSIGILNLNNSSLVKIGNIKSYKIPKKWSGFLAYQLEKEATKEKKKDSTNAISKKDNKIKKSGKENGYHLVIRDLKLQKQDTFKFVTNYIFAKEAKKIAFATTGDDLKEKGGIYVYDLENNKLSKVFSAKKANYFQLKFSDTGKNLGFIVDLDTTKVQIRPNELYLWSEGSTVANKLLDKLTAPKGFRVSSDGAISFSKDESKMYVGLATPPIVKDTTLIDEEIVNVEVWTYNEPRLYTVQELQVKKDRKKSYLTAIHINNNNKLVQLGSLEYPNAAIGNEGNSEFSLVSNSEPYQLESQWTGNTARDYAIVNTTTGKTIKVLTKFSGRIKLSPAGKYVYGYNPVEKSWFTYAIETAKYTKLTEGKVFYDELNDAPNHPYSYGSAGWTKNDESLIIYDRYDVWDFNPNDGSSRRLTKGRENNMVYRCLKLDNEERFINTEGKWLLSTFNEVNKHAGYYMLNRSNNKGKQLISGAYRYSKPLKAKATNKIIFTKENFKEFPNLLYSDLNFKKQTKISNANPQQNNYNWGTAELVNWTSLDGDKLTGMLIKPENFDPTKKYPMIVNFYEKSSNRIFSHKAPSAGRSTINYSFYASRGYLIFNPDVKYRIGYPGESAYSCVISGVTSLIEKGFVDKDNIGVQGHSWGGYQIAYLVTKTNIFKAAESGAPVPNMISAYGGIRWWTGLSRQFQYEHTQSRIGGTPWEYPSRYIENSPIFNIDKINTPLLIMHNDADGHVPWYQGIELFVALRRLGKPSWFLNYNGEPHWPVKLQNRKDFNIRMAQFFDYYLKDKAMPVWMNRGVPALEKGINQGLELMQK